MPEGDKKEVRIETRIETRINAFESTLREIKEQLEKITKKLTKAETREKEQCERLITIENLYSKFSEMRREMIEIKTENRDLRNRLGKIEEKMRWQEKSKIKNNIEIYGIPKRNGENPKETVIKLARYAKVMLEENDLEDTYRVIAKDGSAKQIVTKFKDQNKRIELIKAMKVKKLRLGDIQEQPENKYIFMNEMLTPEAKRILYLTKSEAKNRNWYKTWVYAGDVHVQMEGNGKIIKIENEDQLKTLIK